MSYGRRTTKADRNLPWKVALLPFAERFYEDGNMDAVPALVEAVPLADLPALIDATKRPNATNCWWAIYEVAPTVRACAEPRATEPVTGVEE